MPQQPNWSKLKTHHVFLVLSVHVHLQEKTAAGRMWWAPRSHSRPAPLPEPSPPPAGGGSAAASGSRLCRCARRCGEWPWWCACARPGRAPPSWPSWPSSSLTPLLPWLGSPPAGTASSSPSITSATCARVRRGRRPGRDSGESERCLIKKQKAAAMLRMNRYRNIDVQLIPINWDLILQSESHLNMYVRNRYECYILHLEKSI